VKRFLLFGALAFLAILGLVYGVIRIADYQASAGCKRIAGFTLGEGGSKVMAAKDGLPVTVNVTRVSAVSEVTEGQISVGAKAYHFEIATSRNIKADGIRLSATGRRFGTDTTFVLSDCRK
jgi:hypothetical protein